MQKSRFGAARVIGTIALSIGLLPLCSTMADAEGAGASSTASASFVAPTFVPDWTKRPAEDRIEFAMNLREQLGFDSSRSVAEQMDAAALKHPAFLRFGIPLTADEEREVDRRVALQTATSSLRDELAKDESSSAGLWFDLQAKGRAVVNVTDKTDRASYEAIAQKSGIAPEDIEFRKVAFSLSNLRKQADEAVAAETAALAQQGIAIRQYGPLVDRNRAGVGVSHLDPKMETDLEAAHPNVDFYETAAINQVDDKWNSGGEWKGGLWIHGYGFPYEPGCSTNFSFRRSDGALYFGTAGHCNTAGGTAHFFHNWGTGYTAAYDLNEQQGNADAALIDVPDQYVSNMVVLDSTMGMEVRGVRSFSAVNDLVCRSTGRSKQFLCEFVSAVGQTVHADYGDMHNQVMINTPVEAVEGDSGSSIVTNVLGMGNGRFTGDANGVLAFSTLLAPAGSRKIFYTDVGWVLTELNLATGGAYSFSVPTTTQYRPLTPGHAVNKCLDVTNYSTDNGAKLQQYGCSGAGNQRFGVVPRYGYYSIKGYQSAVTPYPKCIDMPTQLPGNGTQFQQWDCSAAPQQLFLFAHVNNGAWPDFQLQVQHPSSYRCMDVRDRLTGDGVPVQQWDCAPGGEDPNEGNQRWKEIP